MDVFNQQLIRLYRLKAHCRRRSSASQKTNVLKELSDTTAARNDRCLRESEPSMPVHEGLYQASLDNRSFRLVTLKPGLARDAVHVELTCHDMSNSPQYDAISYVWGHHGTMSQIICNGTPTHVRPNLLWVLRRMRHPSQPRTLWIDALCINQNDHAERSLQVTIMGDIYSRAKHVFACIGDDPDGGASDVASLLKGNLEDPQQSDFDPRWVSLGVLLRQPWFSRAWVLQEVGLSQDPKVIYGNVKFRYRDLMELVLWVQRNAQWILSKADIASLLIHTNWYDWSSRGLKSSPSSSLQGNQDYEFLDLLDHASILECQDPRDHVYAFLSHPLAQKRRLNSSDRALITPDYRKSVIDVFKDVSVYLLEQSGLRTLSSVEHNESSIGAHFPSWVIRWDIGHVMNNMDRFPRHPPLYRADTEHKDVASSGTHCHKILGDDLHVRGVVADTIRDIWRISIDEDNKILRFMSRCHDDCSSSLEDVIQYLTLPSTPCVYCPRFRLYHFSQTLCGTTATTQKEPKLEPSDSGPSVPGHDIFSSFNAYRELLLTGSSSGEKEGSAQWILSSSSTLSESYTESRKEWEVDIHAYWQKISAICLGRTFIITEGGYYGLAPWVAEPGDSCCFLSGASVPLLMRCCHRSPQSERFRLVGEMYLEGCSLEGEMSQMIIC